MSSEPRLSGVELGRIVAGRKHAPVVYFARVGNYVKIGTSTNLKARIKDFYLPLKDVLLIVPGGKDVEDAFHAQFGESRVQEEGRRELFRRDGQLQSFLNPQPAVPPVVGPPPAVPARIPLDPENPLMTLREACESGVLKGNLEAVRKAAQRPGFPKSAGWAGMSAVYRYAELAQYQNEKVFR